MGRERLRGEVENLMVEVAPVRALADRRDINLRKVGIPRQDAARSGARTTSVSDPNDSL